MKENGMTAAYKTIANMAATALNNQSKTFNFITILWMGIEVEKNENCNKTAVEKL